MMPSKNFRRMARNFVKISCGIENYSSVGKIADSEHRGRGSIPNNTRLTFMTFQIRRCLFECKRTFDKTPLWFHHLYVQYSFLTWEFPIPSKNKIAIDCRLATAVQPKKLDRKKCKNLLRVMSNFFGETGIYAFMEHQGWFHGTLNAHTYWRTGKRFKYPSPSKFIIGQRSWDCQGYPWGYPQVLSWCRSSPISHYLAH